MPEVIPELVYVVGFFFAVVGYITARGLLATWTHSLGYVLAWLGAHLRIATHLPFGPKHIDVGGPFRTLDSWAITALQTWADGAEIEMGYCLHGMEKVARFTAQMLEQLARATDHTFTWLLHVHLPKWVKWAALAAVPPALLFRLIRAEISKLRPQILKTVRVIEHTITHTVSRVVVKTVPYAIPGIRAIPGLRHEVYGLTKRWARLSHRLRRLEALLGVTGLAVAMANVLGLGTNWRCLTRGNIGRAARGLCRAPTWLLDVFLLASFEAFAIADLCGLLKAEVKLAEWFQPLLMDLVDVDEWLIQNCGYDKAPDLTLPELSFPGVRYGVTLNGARDVKLGLAA